MYLLPVFFAQYNRNIKIKETRHEMRDGDDIKINFEMINSFQNIVFVFIK